MTLLLAQITPEEAMPSGDLPLPLPEQGEPFVAGIMGLLNSYALLFVIAFVVSLLATPIVRRAAIAAGIVDHPDQQRKAHNQPVAYLGGLAVLLGLLAAIGISYTSVGGARPEYGPIPFSIILGIVVITFTGLADDIWGWDPRLKIAGQLVAAAALAIEDVGVNVAAGLLRPLANALEPLLGNADLIIAVPLPGGELPIDVIYWTGTALIAIFVLGGCNAANLLDGLDGLLSGTIAVVAVGLLAISLLMAVTVDASGQAGALTGARIALCFALLGAVLGFLPHNFNPATIFLGDSGSHLLGYVSVAIILMLGDAGQTHLVFAGLIIFAVPIMDTALAMVRRKLSGKPMSIADDQHIHHQLRRALGGVKRAVVGIYAISFAFAVLGVSLAMLVTLTQLRVRVIYAIAIVLFGSIGVYAFKAARRHEIASHIRAVQRQTSAKQARSETGRTHEKPAPTSAGTSAGASTASKVGGR